MTTHDFLEIFAIASGIFGPILAWYLSQNATRKRETAFAIDADREAHDSHRRSIAEMKIHLKEVDRRLGEGDGKMKYLSDSINRIDLTLVRIDEGVKFLKEQSEHSK